MSFWKFWFLCHEHRTKDDLFQAQTSRYLSEFEEISAVGKGSYGKVFKVWFCGVLSWSSYSIAAYCWLDNLRSHHSFPGDQQVGWSVLCCEENSHQECDQRWLHEGVTLVFVFKLTMIIKIIREPHFKWQRTVHSLSKLSIWLGF